MNLKFYIIILSVVTLCFCKSHQIQKRHGIHGHVGMVDGKTKKLENQKESNENETDESNKRVKSSVSTKGNAKTHGNGNRNSNPGHGVLVENLFNGHDILPALGNANEHIIVSDSTGGKKYSYKNFHDNYENMQDSNGNVFDNYVDSRESYEDIFERIGRIGRYDSFDSRGDNYIKSTESVESSEGYEHSWIGGSCLFDKSCSASCGLYNHGFCYLYRCLCFKRKYTYSPSV